MGLTAVTARSALVAEPSEADRVLFSSMTLAVLAVRCRLPVLVFCDRKQSVELTLGDSASTMSARVVVDQKLWY